MNKKEAIEILSEYNEWRRGGHDVMPPPAIIGDAIDFAINELAKESCETLLKQIEEKKARITELELEISELINQ